MLDGRYRVERTIGWGGMAVVHSATHVALDARVAIKMLHPDCRAYPELVERFMQEARVGARLRSEHVARVYDVGSGAYGPYLVMECLEGRDLETIIRDDGPLAVEPAVDAILDACEALAEAHAAGVVHRDLKPANLFLDKRSDRGERVKVLDFGISKIAKGAPSASSFGVTDPGMLMGSPPYMAPEQVTAPGEVDPRTDVWALGATLHELLAGLPPFGLVTNHKHLLEAVSSARTPLTSLRSDVAPELEAIVARCLAFEVRDRFATVAELAHALAPHGGAHARISAGRTARISGVSSGWEIPAPRSTPPCAMDLVEPRPVRAPKKRWGGYATATALLVATVGGTSLGVDAATLERGRVVGTFSPPAQTPEVSAFVAPDPGASAAPARSSAAPALDAGLAAHRGASASRGSPDGGPES